MYINNYILVNRRQDGGAVNHIRCQFKQKKTCCVVPLIIFDSNQCKLVDASQWLVVTLKHLETVISQQADLCCESLIRHWGCCYAFTSQTAPFLLVFWCSVWTFRSRDTAVHTKETAEQHLRGSATLAACSRPVQFTAVAVEVCQQSVRVMSSSVPLNP